jgi:hypothetical protein
MAPEQNQYPNIPQQPSGMETPYQGLYPPANTYGAVMELTGKINTLILQHTYLSDQYKDHEIRLRALEANRWPVPILSVVVAVCALAVALYVAFGK